MNYCITLILQVSGQSAGVTMVIKAGIGTLGNFQFVLFCSLTLTENMSDVLNGIIELNQSETLCAFPPQSSNPEVHGDFKGSTFLPGSLVPDSCRHQEIDS
ncbi:hypothetical protein GOODEAATRI_028773 [Goodea atripinnis]|uniref:Uncharacterized protein n=1 Tax=Goodea atripinnis TaxID=208336 RepID=A0ABV0P233_9TELE